MTNCTCAEVAPRPWRMDGKARMTMVKSRIGRNAPVSNTASASHRVGTGALLGSSVVAVCSSCVDELIYSSGIWNPPAATTGAGTSKSLDYESIESEQYCTDVTE